jgi:myosin heavy subunit
MERNFHIFYAMLAGISAEREAGLREHLKLRDPNSFHYLNQSGCVSDPTIDDVEDFNRV